MASKDVLNTTIVTHAKGKIMLVKHDNRTHLPQGTPSPCVCTVLSAGGVPVSGGAYRSYLHTQHLGKKI